MLHASASFPTHWILLLEAALLVLGLGVAVIAPRPLAVLGASISRLLRRLGRRPALAIGSTSFAAALYLGLHSAVAGAPLPRVVDEWSYLLAADTFAHNRLANPPHPMARHFDGDHVLQRPTYASKYPPAQGMALAVGQVAWGHPVAGLWLEAALLVAATGWMLRAFLPPSWALFGAVLVALRLGAGSYWNESYWGGSIAAIGGALLVGGARRLFRRVRAADGAAVGVGVTLLAASRPYEGMLLALTVGALLAFGLLARRLSPSPWLGMVLPAALVIALGLGGLSSVNRAVTGDPLVFPHQLYDRAHGVPPVFLWQPVAGQADQGWRAPRTSGWHRLAVTLYLFLGLPGALALLVTPAALRDPWSRFATLAFLVVAAGHFLTYPWWPHYSAPALAALLLPAVGGHRLLRVARRQRARGAPADAAGHSPPVVTRGRERDLGRALFGVLCVVQVAVFVVQVGSQRADATDPSRQRARLAWDFEHRPGRHLLLVSYPSGWGSDWTYNPADIDAAKVVWATSLGADRDRDLLAYYPDRTVWAIDAAFTDRDPLPRLVRPALAPEPQAAASDP